MRIKIHHSIALIIVCFLTSCNTTQRKQLNQIDNSIQELRFEIKKIQDILSESNLPRYQILQSTIAARGTFKLDTYEGNVYQLVVDKNNNETWVLLRRVVNNNDYRIKGRRNYELFLSTLAMRFTYLINLNTGATWQLVQDPVSEEIYFTPINDQYIK